MIFAGKCLHMHVVERIMCCTERMNFNIPAHAREQVCDPHMCSVNSNRPLDMPDPPHFYTLALKHLL